MRACKFLPAAVGRGTSVNKKAGLWGGPSTVVAQTTIVCLSGPLLGFWYLVELFDTLHRVLSSFQVKVWPSD